jgi:hypothetical protein
VPILSLDSDVGILQLGSGSSFLGGSIGFRRFMLGVSSNEISPWVSPCGSNCTYNASFSGPALSCDPGDQSNPNVPINPDNVFYNAAFGPDSSEGNGPLELPICLIDKAVLNCTLYNATYDISVQYTDNVQNSQLGDWSR